MSRSATSPTPSTTPTIRLSPDTEVTVTETTVTETTPDELASQRYLFDLALQPVDDFTGFTRLEQIGGSALRYQLSYACYALSLAQYTRTPAFGGYLAEAQANLIRKMCDKRVWGYWATERLAGYLRWNPDPMVFANVMDTGFFAAMLAMYETMNDDRGFDDDGSLPLVWSRRQTYDYGFTRIAQAIETNMRASSQTMYPCEPHLIYPMCNTIALAGLTGYDRLHQTDLTDDLLDKTRDSLNHNGYRLRNGRFLFGRGPLGLMMPPMLANDAVMTYWLNGIMPDMAAETWESLRTNRLRIRNGDVALRTGPIDHLDVGSYHLGVAWAWVNVLCAAKEMGDDEVAQGVSAHIRSETGFERSPEGAHRLAGVSTWVNCAYAFSQFVGRDSLQGLITGRVPEAWRTGPTLDEAAYPDVLVAKALSDSTGLELVLRPGAGAVRTPLRLGRLRPRASYRVDGGVESEIIADDAGSAIVTVELADRHEVRVTAA